MQQNVSVCVQQMSFWLYSAEALHLLYIYYKEAVS